MTRRILGGAALGVTSGITATGINHHADWRLWVVAAVWGLLVSAWSYRAGWDAAGAVTR